MPGCRFAIQVADLGVASRIYQTLVAVLGPANHIWRLTVLALDLDDLSVSLRLSDAMALDYQPVAPLSSHVSLLFS
jgi:hypothetical protein